jgi:D-aminopeptidase
VLHGAPAITGDALDPFFDAVVDASEEAVLESLVASPTVVGRAGNTRQGLPVDDVRALLAARPGGAGGGG